jgi:hypothetical protein
MGPRTVANDNIVNTSFAIKELFTGGLRLCLHHSACQHTTRQPWAKEHTKKTAPHIKWTFVASFKLSTESYISDWRGIIASTSNPKDASNRSASATIGALRRHPRGGNAAHLCTSQANHIVGHNKQNQVQITPKVQTQRSGGSRVEALTDGKAKYCFTPLITVTLCPSNAAIRWEMTTKEMKVAAVNVGT